MRRYREDSERMVRIGNHWVRRPQAEPYQPDTWASALRRNWPEVVFGVLILLSFWIGIPWLIGMAA